MAPDRVAVWEHVMAAKLVIMLGYDALLAVLTIYCVHVYVIALAVPLTQVYIQVALVN